MEEIAILRDHNNQLQERLQYMEVRETLGFEAISSISLVKTTVSISLDILTGICQNPSMLWFSGWAARNTGPGGKYRSVTTVGNDHLAIRRKQQK